MPCQEGSAKSLLNKSTQTSIAAALQHRHKLTLSNGHRMPRALFDGEPADVSCLLKNLLEANASCKMVRLAQSNGVQYKCSRSVANTGVPGARTSPPCSGIASVPRRFPFESQSSRAVVPSELEGTLGIEVVTAAVEFRDGKLSQAPRQSLLLSEFLDC